MSGVSALGSWPGTDIRACVRFVRDVFAGDPGDGAWSLPYLPELPDRGPGAELVGRSAAFLVGLPVDLQPSGWRIVDRPGRDAGRTAAYLRQDLDEMAEAYDGYDGPLKLQVAGPWTLAANVRVGRGERAVVDPGAARDVCQSLAEGLSEHLRTVASLVPGARLVVQLDEPSLPAVLAGHLPTSSGFGTHRAVDPETVERGLRTVIETVRRQLREGGAAGEADGRRDHLAAPGPQESPEAGAPRILDPRHPDVAVHCCAPDVPIALLRSAGVAAVSLDASLLDPSGWESVAVTVEAGVGLWAGLPLEPQAGALAAAELLVRNWCELGLPLSRLDGVVVTPTCGLAGSSPPRARAIHKLAADAARALTEMAGE
ncbi:MAG: methionine synthase [Micrococcales bacterium]|nr:methionine synthase [Micrococcales bacterium]